MTDSTPQELLRLEANRIRLRPEKYNQTDFASDRYSGTDLPFNLDDCGSACCIAGGIVYRHLISQLGYHEVSLRIMNDSGRMAGELLCVPPRHSAGIFWLFDEDPDLMWPKPWSWWWEDMHGARERAYIAADLLECIANALDEGVQWEDMHDHLATTHGFRSPRSLSRP